MNDNFGVREIWLDYFSQIYIVVDEFYCPKMTRILTYWTYMKFDRSFKKESQWLLANHKIHFLLWIIIASNFLNCPFWCDDCNQSIDHFCSSEIQWLLSKKNFFIGPWSVFHKHTRNIEIEKRLLYTQNCSKLSIFWSFIISKAINSGAASECSCSYDLNKLALYKPYGHNSNNVRSATSEWVKTRPSLSLSLLYYSIQPLYLYTSICMHVNKLCRLSFMWLFTFMKNINGQWY